MLIHLRPTFFLDRALYATVACVRIMDTLLSYNGDLSTKHPYADKRFYVGCRNSRKEDGILIEIEPVGILECGFFWEWWEGEKPNELTHYVDYTISDQSAEVLTDGRCLAEVGYGGWPVISAYPADIGPKSLEEEITRKGLVLERYQTWELRGISREHYVRVRSENNKRLPPIESAFRV
jgi:hypothetical protein